MQVNNYECGVYDDAEVWIQTEPHQLAINKGRVFLTIRELKAMVQMLEEAEIDRGNSMYSSPYD